jgi:hypothetical protein
VVHVDLSLVLGGLWRLRRSTAIVDAPHDRLMARRDALGSAARLLDSQTYVGALPTHSTGRVYPNIHRPCTARAGGCARSPRRRYTHGISVIQETSRRDAVCLTALCVAISEQSSPDGTTALTGASVSYRRNRKRCPAASNRRCRRYWLLQHRSLRAMQVSRWQRHRGRDRRGTA